MNLFSFFTGRRTRTVPHANPTVQLVNVKPPKGHRCVIDNDPAPMEFNPDPATVAQIRRSLPNAPSDNLRAARAAAVLDRYADYLEGQGPAPELGELIAAQRYAAEYMRDQIVVGGSRA